jgi:hypothetical protein
MKAAWLIAALALAFPATAFAKTARFRASVEGVQRIAWTVDTADACGGTYRGSGSEVVRFHSIRPQRLTVRSGRVPTFAMGRRWARFDTRGRVTRDGAVTYTPDPNGGACGDGGGGGDPVAPPPPDCGTKRFRLLPLVPEPVGRNAIRLGVGDPAPLPPFSACPVYGPAFPDVLPARTRLPMDELFDDSIGKELVLGRGHRHESAAGITVDTRLEWTLTLARIR